MTIEKLKEANKIKEKLEIIQKYINQYSNKNGFGAICYLQRMDHYGNVRDILKLYAHGEETETLQKIDFTKAFNTFLEDIHNQLLAEKQLLLTTLDNL